MTELGGALYGTSSGGAGRVGPCKPKCYGTVFSIAKSRYQILYRFKGGSDGSVPESKLINVDGVLYGTTYAGGGTSCLEGGGCGTVYSITPSGTEKVLYRFQGNGDGANPAAGLTYFSGSFYGTTSGGGNLGYPVMGCTSTGCGAVFKLTPKGSSYVETIVYRFSGKEDGAVPSSGLTFFEGALYGVTSTGGRGWFYGGACGVIYRIDDTGTVSNVHEFTKGSRGCQPAGDMAVMGGALYGTTMYGGHGWGSVFEYSSGGAFQVLYRFSGGGDGENPGAGVIAADGKLYGTTYYGGSLGCFAGAFNGCGTVFEITP